MTAAFLDGLRIVTIHLDGRLFLEVIQLILALMMRWVIITFFYKGVLKLYVENWFTLFTIILQSSDVRHGWKSGKHVWSYGGWKTGRRSLPSGRARFEVTVAQVLPTASCLFGNVLRFYQRLCVFDGSGEGLQALLLT